VDELGTDWLDSHQSLSLDAPPIEAETSGDPATAESSPSESAQDNGQEIRAEPDPWSVDDVLSDLASELASEPAAGPGPEPEAAIGRAPDGDPAFEADPGGGGAERRCHERVSVIEAALIVDGDHHFPCVILDRSEGGAALRLSDPDQDCAESFTLQPLDGPARRCTQRWREGDKIGVEFS